ncbi:MULTISPECIES: hypothetical protein [Vibrio]|uniref:hypothetical protein n=1 Tax=Vibrio TaxID=662 RepID=UPI000587B902|nr:MULTISPECIES: hypothetical protein [Vibrio]MCM5511657.1 hypothetical protein [Vibrio sp. SCSIO 43169]MDE3896054.1 hypothetical protein [Vibrio sp. CC007]
MEPVYFKDASTVFQLAFGLNLVAGLWIKNYSSAREQFWKKFENTVSHIAPEHDLNSPNLFKALETLLPDFKLMTNYCLLMIVYSAFTVLLCFFALLNPVIDPLKTINPYMFVFMSTVFLLINPVLYYLFNDYYKTRLAIYCEVLEAFVKDSPELIFLVAEGHDSLQENKELSDEIQVELRKVKLLELALSAREFIARVRGKIKTMLS